MRARMCARRLTRPSSMTMRSASARASGFLLWSFPRRGRAAALPTSRLARPPLQRSPENAPVAPGRHVGQPDVRRMAELLTRGSASVGRRCAQRGPGPPGVRAERLAPGRGASSAGGTRHGPAGPARDPRRVGTCLPGAGPTRTRDCAQQSGPVRLVCDAESRHADAGVRPVVRQDGNHLEFEWEDAPGSGRSVGRSGALCHSMVFFACELLTRAGQQVPAGCRWRGLLATACELPTRGSVSAGPVRSVPSGITGGPGRSLVPGVTLRRHTPRLGRHRPAPKGASAGRGRSAGSRRPGFDGGQLADDDTHGAAGRGVRPAAVRCAEQAGGRSAA